MSHSESESVSGSESRSCSHRGLYEVLVETENRRGQASAARPRLAAVVALSTATKGNVYVIRVCRWARSCFYSSQHLRTQTS